MQKSAKIAKIQSVKLLREIIWENDEIELCSQEKSYLLHKKISNEESRAVFTKKSKIDR